MFRNNFEHYLNHRLFFSSFLSAFVWNHLHRVNYSPKCNSPLVQPLNRSSQLSVSHTFKFMSFKPILKEIINFPILHLQTVLTPVWEGERCSREKIRKNFHTEIIQSEYFFKPDLSSKLSCFTLKIPSYQKSFHSLSDFKTSFSHCFLFSTAQMTNMESSLKPEPNPVLTSCFKEFGLCSKFREVIPTNTALMFLSQVLKYLVKKNLPLSYKPKFFN